MLSAEDIRMSRFSITPAIAVEDKEMPDGVYRTLAALGIHANTKTGWCWPSLARLAGIRGISKQAVSKHIQWLKKNKYVNILPRYNKETGGRKSNRVQVRYDYPDSQSQVDRVSTSEVDGVSPSGVDRVSTSEVDVNDLVNDLVNDRDSNADEKSSVLGANGQKPKSAYVKNMELLEQTFSIARGCDSPDWENDARGLQKTWRAPLNKLLKKCEGDVALAILAIQEAVSQMRSDKLTFTKPIQIMENAESWLIDRKNPQNSTFRQL